MNLFADLEAPAVEKLDPRDRSLDDCKSKLRVQLRDLKKRPDCVSVSVRIGGVTPLKIGEKGEMSIPVLRTRSNKASILEYAKGLEDEILDAHKRYIDSLNIARTTRETTRIKPRSKTKDPVLVVNNVTTS
jgi:hypothetical protein